MAETARIWVDRDFKKALRKEAAESELTVAEFTKRLAKEGQGVKEFFLKTKGRGLNVPRF